MMIVLPNKHYNGHHTTTEIEADHKNTRRGDLQKEMGTAGLKYRWRKMEVEAQDRTRWRGVICGICSMWSDKA